MSAYYDVYIKGILNLVATLVVKSTFSAEAINSRLTALGYTVDDTDPTTWKYYQNLAGIYHASNTMMTITSLDTLETIDFTQASLALHRATRREYTYGSRYYNELLDRYPDQESLILGVLNPVDRATAIAADDHTILYYDTTLVEAGEQQLIPKLQEWILGCFERWDNTDYHFCDSLYTATLLGILFAQMPQQIHNIRLDACRTDQAHSFHIRQYLESFSGLGDEYDLMSQRQRLFFYRNLNYINRHVGMEATFETLTDKVLTDRGFSLAAYTLQHNYQALEETLDPATELLRSSINGIEPASGLNVKTVTQVLELEEPLASGNEDILAETQVSVPLRMKNSLFSSLNTKVLESNAVDNTDGEPFTLADVLLNHWPYLANTGRYTAVITVTNPSTNDTLRLSARDAFALYLYCWNKAMGFTLPTLPRVMLKRVRRIPLPTYAEYRGLAPVSMVPDYYVQQLLDDQSAISQVISVDAFKELATDIHQRMLRHRELRAYNQDFKVEGLLHQMVDRTYMDYPMQLGDSDAEEYDQWLLTRSLDLSGLNALEFDTLAAEILTEATGANLSTVLSVREIHASMVRIMSQLSSYSVQYIQTINTSPLKIIDWKLVRLSKPTVTGGDYKALDGQVVEILDHSSRDYHEVAIDEVATLGVHRGADESHKVELKIESYFKLSRDVVTFHSISLPPLVGSSAPKEITPLSTLPDSIEGYTLWDEQSLASYISTTSLSGYESFSDARRRAFLGL